jgi:erythromycin esterase-like protein
MSSFPSRLTGASSSFALDGEHDLAAAICSVFIQAQDPPELLALGEPTHGEPAFPQLRNRIFQLLVDQGFRSIAVESDAVAALEVDAFLQGTRGTLDSTMARGFSHGFGQLEANRELVAWMRTRNDALPPARRLAFYGIDAPLEMTGAPSPRRYLGHLRGYLIAQLGSDSLPHGHEELEQLLGDDERWSDPAAQMDAEKSVGASTEVAALRVIADDLVTTLYAQAPRLVAASSLAAWHGALVHGRAALGLLRYHAQAANPAPPAERTSRMLGVRDVLMAQNLLAIRAREQHRGPTLVFAHNRRGSALVEAAQISAVLDHGEHELHRRTVTADQGYFPLDAATLQHSNAVLHVASWPGDHRVEDAAPTAADLAAQILLALPDVTHLRADEESGAPEGSWGDWFFFAGADHRMPFATIVEHDTPGFDEDSHLDRPGVFRLNIGVGREEFAREFGFPPAQLADRRANLDFAKLDNVLPHPAYGTQGWACILNPITRRRADIQRLLAHAHRRALERHHRRTT